MMNRYCMFTHSIEADIGKYFKRIVAFISRAEKCKGRVRSPGKGRKWIYFDRSSFIFSPSFAFSVCLCLSQILVHCTAGSSRAPTAVISYLVIAKKIPLVDAYKYVRTLRPLTNPNNKFLLQLALLEVG